MDARLGQPGRDRRRTRRRRGGVVVALGVLAVALVVVVLTATGRSEEPPQEPATAYVGAAPTDPPVRVCGNHDVLDGPREPPDGAVVVTPAHDLGQLTREHPAGTTFWLAPGTHRLAPEPYAQVTPKDGNTYLGAPGSVLDGARTNLYAFTGEAEDVTIANVTVTGFGPEGGNNDAGVVNHDAGRGWTIRASTVEDNAGAAVMLGSGNVLRDSCLQGNGQYGFNAYHPDGVQGLTLQGNEIAGNNTDDWERVRPGCGCSGGGKFWEVDGATISGNWIHDNRSVGLWVDTNSRGFTVSGNYIDGNHAQGIIYETSYNAAITDNTFARNGLVEGPADPGFPTAAVYISESGSDPRVPGPHSTTFEVVGNRFLDNWSGVVLWENADRFAGSPSNTSTGSGTLVNPDQVTAGTCTEDTIADPPFYDDCRWKTQNVRVRGNLFSYSPTKVGPDCGAASGCGFNGLFSNWGSWPPWTPYEGQTVEDQITFDQDNVFSENTYVGPWRFVVHEQGNVVTFDTWRADPYGQDAASTLR